MGQMWKPMNPETLKTWCNTIVDEAEDELNDWELKFIGDMQVRLAGGFTLTQSQEEKLEQIYADKTK